jgi:hypothetical protein
MKTIHIACLSVLSAIILFSSCKKDEQDYPVTSNQQNAVYSTARSNQAMAGYYNWQESFTTSKSLSAGWILFGSRQPRWVSSAFGKFGLFDNNGLLPDGSGAISKCKIGNGSGYIIETEVYIDVTNPNGTTICPEIGVTRYLHTTSDEPGAEAGISMKLLYIGSGVASVKPEYQNHTYVLMSSLVQDGSISSSSDPSEGTVSSHGEFAFQTDVAGNGWHKMKIVVDASNKVSFFLDGQFVWSPKKPVHASLLKDKNVLLGFTSPGNAGKAYHDYVRVTYPAFPDKPFDVDNPVLTE